MRWLSRLLVILALCLVSVALPAAPAQASSPYIILSPSSRVPGDEATIYGYNFTANTGVDVYYYLDTTNTTDRERIEVETDDDGYFTVTFEVPESYKGTHEVSAYIDTNLQATENFTVKPGLTVSPTNGPVGTNVTVTGHGFAENETGIKLSYYLNSTYSSQMPGNTTANATGSWDWTFPIPPSTKGNHRIDAQGASSSLLLVRDVFFEVTPGISLSKLSGSPGENITVTGSGFYANDRYITILFAGEEVNAETRVDADAAGYWTKVFEVPDMPKGTYNVTAYGESTLKAAVNVLSFEIKPGIVLSPDAGHVGTDLTVTGGGFAPDKDVVIMYENEDNRVATDTTDNTGSFVASFSVPESQHGQRQVIARDAARNSATAIFNMESVPPGTPTLGSPFDGSRVGFIGKVRPTFNWSAVSDVSGVYYSLQIATSKNVTTAGNFTDPLVSVSNITGTNYTLNTTEALPYGTYYWIVQAVDRAGNAGNWTTAYSFHAGLLPLWAFIVIVVAIVAGIGTAVYFFILRRRIHYY